MCGSTSGRVRQIGVVASGGGAAGGGGGVREVESAAAGQPVRIVVSWDRSSNAGAFEVGDVVRAWPKEDALALASYRQSVEAFVATRVAEPGDDDDASATTEVAAEDEAVMADEGAEGAEAERASADAPVILTRAQQLGKATGAAAIVKTSSAGELQGMLDFLASRQTGDRLILLACALSFAPPPGPRRRLRPGRVRRGSRSSISRGSLASRSFGCCLIPAGTEWANRERRR